MADKDLNGPDRVGRDYCNTIGGLFILLAVLTWFLGLPWLDTVVFSALWLIFGCGIRQLYRLDAACKRKADVLWRGRRLSVIITVGMGLPLLLGGAAVCLVWGWSNWSVLPVIGALLLASAAVRSQRRRYSENLNRNGPAQDQPTNDDPGHDEPERP